MEEKPKEIRTDKTNHMKKIFTPEVRIALVAIIAVIIIYVGIHFLKGLSIVKDKDSYHARLQDVSGLDISSPVLANGYPVGIVSAMEYDYKRNNSVIITMDVTKGMKIPKGSTIELSKEMLGSTKMNLVLAPNSNGFLQLGDTITGGWEIGLMNMASTMAPKVEQLLPKLDSIFTGINLILSDPSIAQTIHNTEQLTNNLRTTSDHINALVSNVNNDLETLTRQTSQLIAALESTTANVNQKLNKVDGLIDNMDINELTAKLNHTLTNLEQLSNSLNNPDNSLNRVLNSDATIKELESTINSAKLLLDDIRNHPKRYVSFSVFGKKDKAPKQE